MTDTHDSAEHRNPWDRIPGEPDRVYRAFECFLDVPYWEGKDLYAYRKYVGNPNASHVSETWLSCKEEFFWEERVRAYDYHVQRKRREQTIRAYVEAGYERGDELDRMEEGISSSKCLPTRGQERCLKSSTPRSGGRWT